MKSILFLSLLVLCLSSPKKAKESFNTSDIFANIKKTNVVYNFPKLPFGDSLEDLDFLLLVQDSINYICYFQTNEFLVYIKDLLGKIENYTQNIFIFPNILKDIKKNGIKQ